LDHSQLSEWIASYERAWRTAGTDQLGELFTADATYSAGPFEPTIRGMDEIARMWEAERKGPDEPFRMTSEIVAVEGDTGVSRMEVWYDGPPALHYRDLWIVRLDDSGRCTHFEEWPFWPELGTRAPSA
jgi:ketosteroid isomerase-like protein